MAAAPPVANGPVLVPPAWHAIDPAALTTSIYARERRGDWVGYVEARGTDGPAVRKYFSGPLRRVVREKIEAFVTAQKAAHAAHRTRDRDRQTLGDFLEFWLTEVVTAEESAGTLEKYGTLVRRHLIPGLGAIALRALAPEDIQSFLNAKRQETSPQTGRPFSASYLHDMLTVLRIALGQARRWRRIAENPAELVSAPGVRRPEIRPLTEAQSVALLHAAREHRWEAAIVLGLAVGLRISEVIGLRWEDVAIDWETPRDKTGRLHLRQGYRRVLREHKARDLKSARSRRTVHLPAVAVAALRLHRARQGLLRRQAGEAWRETGLVVTTGTGTVLDAGELRAALRRLAAEAGLPDARDLRFHDLRHTCATLLLAAEVGVHEVSAILGHADAGFTLRTYAHFLDSRRDMAAGRIDAVLGKGEGGDGF